MTEALKECRACKASLPLSEFWKEARSKDGLRADCKACCSASNKKWAERNRERRSAYHKKWGEQNRERISALKKVYWEENREKLAKDKRDWQQNNPEKVAKINRKWTQNNPEKHRAQSQRRRAAKALVGTFFISKKEIAKIYSSPCFYCGSKGRITMDHVIPLSRGGWHSIGNLVAACKSCNSSKGTKTITEWKMFKMKLAGGKN